MGEVVELALPARPEVLAVARLVVTATVSTEPLFDYERIEDLRLAVSEACTNAIEAHERAGAGLSSVPIMVRCSVGDGRVEVQVHDHGVGFDPSALTPHPPVTDPARLDHERGLGIALIRLLSDDVQFQPGPDGTTVTMTFVARPAAEDEE